MLCNVTPSKEPDMPDVARGPTSNLLIKSNHMLYQ